MILSQSLRRISVSHMTLGHIVVYAPPPYWLCNKLYG